MTPFWPASQYLAFLKIKRGNLRRSSGIIDDDAWDLIQKLIQAPNQPATPIDPLFLQCLCPSDAHDLVQQQPTTKNEGKQLYLSLQNVPAKCIVPYARQDWLDQMEDLVPYCIVLGDDCANLKVTGPADYEDLHIRLL